MRKVILTVIVILGLSIVLLIPIVNAFIALSFYDFGVYEGTKND